MSRYIALLRGINVGGKNLIRMADLRTCFEDCGFADVATYIQSGNVRFEAGRAARADVARRIEDALRERFAYEQTVVLRSRAQLRRIVRAAPLGFGAEPETYRYDVLFLAAPLRAASAMKRVETREGVDTAVAGPGVLYFSRLIERASQSRLRTIASTPIYRRLTVRNWNTTTKLLRLVDADG